MEGIAGTPGSNGVNGSNIELFRGATHLQWRVVGTVTWADLIAWVDLKGDTGAAGTTGATGAPGTPGTNGTNGTNGLDAKRIVAATGSTNASGDVSFTFSPAFAVAPHIDITLTPQTNVNHKARLTAVSTTGCTVRVEVQNQAFLSLLGLDILGAGVTVVNAAAVSITATER
jgi:hypothetical protein